MAESKFYCENCGAAVKHSAKVCPHCGRFFSAVRCPKCFFTGEAALFRKGCPNCGYAGSWQDSASGNEFSVENYEARRTKPGGAAGRGTRTRQQGVTPWWVYWLAMAILAAAFVVLVLIYIAL